MTADPNEETVQDPRIQEMPQEDAPRRRRTLSGRLVPASLSTFDPWHALTSALDLAGRREARKAARAEERAAKALSVGLAPDAGLPKVACLKRGCRLPWDDHLTAAGKLRAPFARAGGHASAADVPPRQMDRRERRALVRSMTTRPGRRLAPAALYTHTIFVDPNGRKYRVPNDKLDAFVLRNAKS